MAKKLLKEAVVRRFQKLANVSAINEMYKNEQEDLMEEEDDAIELSDEDEAPEEKQGDLDGMDDMDADMDGDTLELTDDKAQEFVDAVESISEFAEMIKSQMPDDMDDMDADMDDMGAGMDDMGADEDNAEEEIMEALRGISYVPSKGEVVNEVAKRVARRLKKAKLHEAKLNRALGKSSRRR